MDDLNSFMMRLGINNYDEATEHKKHESEDYPQIEIIWVDRMNVNGDILRKHGYRLTLYRSTRQCIQYINYHRNKSNIKGIITAGMRGDPQEPDGIAMIQQIFKMLGQNIITAMVTRSIHKDVCYKNGIDIYCNGKKHTYDPHMHVQQQIIAKIEGQFMQQNDLMNDPNDYGESYYFDQVIDKDGYGQPLKAPIKFVQAGLSPSTAKARFAQAAPFLANMGPVGNDFDPDVDELALDPRWNRTYGDDLGGTSWGKPQLRGLEPYYCPKGWQRFSYEVRDCDKKYKDWPIAYHGTKFECFMMISLTALMCSDNGYGHGPGVYLSPSIKYASHTLYATPVRLDIYKAVKAGWSQQQIQKYQSCHGKFVQIVLEYRVNPNMLYHPPYIKNGTPGYAFKKAETMWLTKPENRHLLQDGQFFDNVHISELEWWIPGKVGVLIKSDKIVISGFMIKISDYDPKQDDYVDLAYMAAKYGK